MKISIFSTFKKELFPRKLYAEIWYIDGQFVFLKFRRLLDVCQFFCGRKTQTWTWFTDLILVEILEMCVITNRQGLNKRHLCVLLLCATWMDFYCHSFSNSENYDICIGEFTFKAVTNAEWKNIFPTLKS